MPPASEKANEFKRYRQILAALYIGTITAGFLLLAVSVVRELLFRSAPALTEPALSESDPDPQQLLRCHGDVLGLYEELGRFTTRLFDVPARSQPDEIIPRWEAFSRSWLDRWEAVDARCRFTELAGAHMGEAYDQLAEVHGRLPTIRLQYQSLLVRFGEEQAADLDRVRRDLDRSRQLLATTTRRHGGEAP